MIFISGGVRSGKSTFAEEIVNKGTNKLYIATAVVRDDEMAARVKDHQIRRVGYSTIEQPNNLDEIIKECSGKDVLLDCLTNWLSNEMFQTEMHLDCVDAMIETIKRIDEVSNSFVIVSNDVFQGITNYEELTMKYVENLGDLHQKIVMLSDEVYELYAGIRIRRK